MKEVATNHIVKKDWADNSDSAVNSKSLLSYLGAEVIAIVKADVSGYNFGP